MGKDWDHGVPGERYWEAIRSVCRPGAMLLAFGGTRTFHRLACAIEDAGWEIRDCVMWVYGSGFPKSHDISKAIDKAAGHQRGSDYEPNYLNATHGRGWGGGQTSNEDPPVTASARQWQGYGTALKPAYESIIVAMNPLDGTFANNALEHGVAGVNVDGCRVGAEVRMRGDGMSGLGVMHDDEWKPEERRERSPVSGRWPANLIHDGSEEVLELFPVTKSGSRKRGVRKGMGYHGADGDGGPEILGDSGSAARFFKACPQDKPHRMMYCAKASRKERDAGLDCEEKPLNWSSGAKNPGSFQAEGTKRSARNHHPTVKPLALTEYLAKLILPPECSAPRRLLVPFAGSGSEMIGAHKAGWDDVIGVELEREYVEIARARLGHWTKQLIEDRLL